MENVYHVIREKCGFETVFHAIGDMEDKKDRGEIIDFIKIEV